MKLILVFASLVVAISASTDEELWAQFKHDQGKTYRSLRDDKLRFAIFQSNLRVIEEHNKKYEKGEVSWYKGINKFTDMTDEEFQKQYLNFNPSEIHPATAHFESSNVSAPDSLDWRKEGAVLSVKDQGTCGGCWAFSAVAALEGQNAIKKGVHTDLSPQELVDCAGGKYNNEGCNGGWMDWAFDYIKDHGISTEKDYPYTGRDDRCKGNRNTAQLKVTGFTDVQQNEHKLQEAVASVGPIAVAINANFIKDYAGGIFDNFFCFANLNHAVLAVGYGTENHHDYWIIKNSWGQGWGDQGYIKMTRNRFNQCGISSRASYPNLA